MRAFSAKLSDAWVLDIHEIAMTCRFSQFKPPGEFFMGVDRVAEDPALETLAEIWSPLIGSLSVTALVLGLIVTRPRPVVAGLRAGDDCTAIPRGWLGYVSHAMIAVALLGLNVAAVVYRPPLDSSGPEFARHLFGKNGVYLIKGEGDFESLSPNRDLVFTWSREAGSAQPGPEYPRGAIPNADILKGLGIKIATIVVGDDGSVLGYGGRAGEVTSNPIVLRLPTRSRLEMWWPLLASSAITVVACAVLWQRGRRGRHAAGITMGTGPAVAKNARPWLEWAIIAATLAVLNCGAVIEARNARLRAQASRVRLVERQYQWLPSRWDDSWGIGFSMGKLDTGLTLMRLVRLPMRPSPLAIWSPVIAGLSITLLTILVLAGPHLQAGATNMPLDHATKRAPRLWPRRAMAAAAVIGLNGAAAFYGPFPEPGYEEPCPLLFEDPSVVPDMDGARLIRGGERRLMIKPADGGSERPATAADYPPPLYQDDARTRVKDTIVYRSDGSVVAYAGNPGLWDRLISRPRVIKPPTRSLLDVWWPVIASVSISFAAIGVLWRQDRCRREPPF